ncbi:hypothetical protein QFC21_006436 [Naganishia friedmannii]|uniref:Uncharacterized protein n=1 Tax=Naganishia friedmannii TaxID=89922 RepID=A0ACC2V3I6_9TREE|nr:hypothetical protein QFC21_006436 [Naganishia friedmannii]
MSDLLQEDIEDAPTIAIKPGSAEHGDFQIAKAETLDMVNEDEDPEAGEMTYEEQRLATIRENEQLLKSLGLAALAPPSRRSIKVSTASTPTSSGTPTKRTFKKPIKRELIPTEPLRKSSRISAAAKVKEEEGSKTRKRKHKRPKLDRNASSLTPLSGSGNQSSGFESDQSSSDTASSSTRNRKPGQVRLPPGERIRIPLRSIEYAADGGDVKEEDYDTVRPIPRRENGEKGRLVFEGRWQGVFVPNLTPEEVFRGGAFGGNYYADAFSNILKQNLSAEDDIAELPSSWLRPPSPSLATNEDNYIPFSSSTHLTAPARDPSVNRYGVPAGQGLVEWEKSGWIWKGDPRGWMQWYVRFYNGRRCVDDERQVQRCRFARALMKKIAQQPGSGGASVDNTAVEEEDVGRVMRQVCWQWGLVMDREEWRKRVAGSAV